MDCQEGRCYIAAADAGEFHFDEDIVGIFEAGDRPVFEDDFILLFEDEGEVLTVLYLWY